MLMRWSDTNRDLDLCHCPNLGDAVVARDSRR